MKLPVLRRRAVLELAKGMKLFLNLNTGLTRGPAPGSEQTPQQQDRQLERMQKRLSELERRSEESTAALHRLGAALSEAMGSLRAKPNTSSSHSLLRYVDERGKRVLGFRDGIQEDGSAANEAATYRGFQDVFRGDEQSTKDRQTRYLNLLSDRAWVLDAGCGRGEFLDLLREQGIKGVGVDADEGMVERCRAKGHDDVVLGDANGYLRGRGDGSVPAIFAAQVVEHLPYGELTEFLRLAEAKLEAGGVLIFETVNYHAPEALKAFWLDPTHQHPVLPELALMLCRLAGFGSARVVFPDGSGDDPEEGLSSSLYYTVIAAKEASDPYTEREEMRRDGPTRKKKLSAEEVRAAIAGVDHWFHRIEVAPGIVTPGIHDAEQILGAMELPDNLDNKRVLDIGARDGYFSFAAEARGAEVLAIDTVPPDLTGFEVAASLLNSSVEYKAANVYDLRPEEVGSFDIIFFLGVLYHLRDPMLALDRLWSIARPGARIWIESHVIDHWWVDPTTGDPRELDTVAPAVVDVPIARYYPKGELDNNPSNWWGPNLSGLRAMVESAGFMVADTRLLFRGGRALVSGYKVEDAETNFWRSLDREAGVRDRGMAWEYYEGR